jgi:8-hydroxy-5-deazaflavin:NADPH oxidoreductase
MPAEAAQDADALLLAVHWLGIDDGLKHAGDLSGKVMVTCSLSIAHVVASLAAMMRSLGGADLLAETGCCATA